MSVWPCGVPGVGAVLSEVTFSRASHEINILEHLRAVAPKPPAVGAAKHISAARAGDVMHGARRAQLPCAIGEYGTRTK